MPYKSTVHYESIFDKIEEGSPFGQGNRTFSSYVKYHGYTDSLNEVLDELEIDLSKNVDDPRDLLRMALNAPRVIRAAVDFKIDNPSNVSETLVRSSIGLGLDIYRNSPYASKKVRDFRVAVKSHALQLLSAPLIQPEDHVTWNATNPKRSRRSAEGLFYQANGDEVLFIALAHGGVAAGMDIYLRYCDMARTQNSGLYVVRFSTDKKHDRAPRITSREKEYIKDEASGRRIVVFDEDVATGTTKKLAVAYFSDVFGEVPIFLTNLQMQQELFKLGINTKELHGRSKYHDSIKKIYTESVLSKQEEIFYKSCESNLYNLIELYDIKK